MSTLNLLDALSKLLNCEIVALHDYLNHPMAGNKINEFLKDKNMRTTYMNREMEQNIVPFGGFSLNPACQQSAYEGYLGVNVQQHFYCRHRIRLMFPRLRCVIEYGKSGHNKYYPLELLELYSDDSTTTNKELPNSPEVPLEKKNADNYSFLTKVQCKENGGKLLIDETKWCFLDPEKEPTQQQEPDLVDTRINSWYNCYYSQ